MIPAVELAKEAKINIFIYFPPHQFSSNLATMGSGIPLQMRRYENKFKNALFPDTITLSNGFELSIPSKWKTLQNSKIKYQQKTSSHKKVTRGEYIAFLILILFVHYIHLFFIIKFLFLVFYIRKKSIEIHK